MSFRDGCTFSSLWNLSSIILIINHFIATSSAPSRSDYTTGFLQPRTTHTASTTLLNDDKSSRMMSSEDEKKKSTSRRLYRSPFLASTTDDDDSETLTALIILNRPIPNPTTTTVFSHLWSTSSIKICADGGANRLHEATQNLSTDYSPDAIVGDLDSLSSTVEEFYRSRGVSIIRDPDQDSNDLDKCIRYLHRRNARQQQTDSFRVTIAVYGAFGGRFDQSMASIQALFEHSSNDIRLYTEETVAWYLPPHVTNEIIVHREREGPSCGLLPIGEPCRWIRTNGLKWNLDGEGLKFGGLVSTSNALVGDVVTVTCESGVVWTMEMTGGSPGD